MGRFTRRVTLNCSRFVLSKLNRLRCTTSTLGSLTMRRTCVADVQLHPSFSQFFSTVSGVKNPRSNDASSTCLPLPELSGNATEMSWKVSLRTHLAPHSSHVDVLTTSVVKFVRVGHKVLCRGTILWYAAVTSSSRVCRKSRRNSCASCCWLPTYCRCLRCTAVFTPSEERTGSCDSLLAATSLRTALYTDRSSNPPSASGFASTARANSSSPQSTWSVELT